jgi:cyclic pyranopterin phosphate synthase
MEIGKKMLIDSFQRQITYLRISVTDRCNFRCVYCMPTEGIEWQPHETIMPYEDIAKFVRIAVEAGIREVRITGGEPLVRKNIEDLVRQISEIKGIQDLSLTTNGVLLKRHAKALADAGLKRVNVSLDTLRPELYRKITRGGELQDVLDGIEAAEQNRLIPIKINTVVMKGVNSNEIRDLANLTVDHAWNVRFIELMPIQNQKPWGNEFPSPQSMYMPIAKVKEHLESFKLKSVPNPAGEGPAEDFHMPNSKGSIGFISPLSQSFCKNCNRLRLTADGNLRPCLLSDVEIPVWKTLKEGGDVLGQIKKAVQSKPENHELDGNSSPSIRCMMQIGG